jgi:hypothetical protein
MNPNQILQQAGGVVGHTARISERVGRRVLRDGYGLVRRARHTGQESKPSMDDVTLARKVETEIFRTSRAAKSTVNVNVVDGVVWLRGEVRRADQIRSLERKAESVPEVRSVENLLHLRKTPAPTRADTPRRQQRTRSSTKRPTPSRQKGGRITDDRTDALVAEREPSPAEHAEQSTGGTPPPLGSDEIRPDDAGGSEVATPDVGGREA